jgi:glutamate dehydrogenase (NADP+)
MVTFRTDNPVKLLVAQEVKAIDEGTNMPSTLGVIEVFLEGDVLFGPAKSTGFIKVMDSMIAQGINNS